MLMQNEFLEDIFVGPPTSGDVSFLFQSQSGQLYLHLAKVIHLLRFICGVTPADLLVASIYLSSTFLQLVMVGLLCLQLVVMAAG